MYFFGLLCVPCRMLIPQPGITSMFSAVDSQSLNLWTTRESLEYCVCFFCFVFFLKLSVTISPILHVLLEPCHSPCKR